MKKKETIVSEVSSPKEGVTRRRLTAAEKKNSSGFGDGQKSTLRLGLSFREQKMSGRVSMGMRSTRNPVN